MFGRPALGICWDRGGDAVGHSRLVRHGGHVRAHPDPPYPSGYGLDMRGAGEPGHIGTI